MPRPYHGDSSVALGLCYRAPPFVTPKLYIAVLGLAACGKSDEREAPTTADPPSVIAATAADGAEPADPDEADADAACPLPTS